MEHRGCEEPVKHVVCLVENETVHQCPVAMVTNQTQFFLRLHTHYSNGYLAVGGGVMNQGNRYLQAMEIIDAKINEINEERRKEHERKLRQKTR